MHESRKRDSPFSLEAVIDEIRSNGNPHSLAGMARYGIQTKNACGVPVPRLRAISKNIGRHREMAQQLWKTGIHEARILAGMIDDPALVDEDQMEDWAKDFDSWDLVDGSCGNLFDKTSFAVKKAHEWSARKEEYVKRAGFVLMAELAVHDKKATNSTFQGFLPLIVREASDERNFVKKAVNWALRQIGKRNAMLNGAAIRTCKQLQRLDSRSAKWIASNALRELTSEAVQKKLKSTEKRTRS
jgi:3-methyladenine DNA glycosylase AlkD